MNRLEVLRAHNAAAADLALRVCLALRIDGDLLRRTRLRLLPAADASAEADLWFSGAVQVRGGTGIVLLPEVTSELRRTLAADQELLGRVFAVVAEAHAKAPELVKVEDELAFLALRRGDPDTEMRIATLLRRVIAAMHQGPDRVRDLAAWSLWALPRLPAVVSESDEGQALLMVAAQRLPRPAEVAPALPSARSLRLVAPLLPGGERVPIAYRRTSSAVELRRGPVEQGTASSGWHQVLIPAASPWIEVVGCETVTLDGPGVARVSVDGERVRLRTPDGAVLELRPFVDPRERLRSAGVRIQSRVETGRILGTGYFVAADLVVTSAHVLKYVSAKEVSVVDMSQQSLAVISFSVDHESDCAVLRLEQPIAGRGALELDVKDVPTGKWMAYAFGEGSPEGEFLSGHIFEGSPRGSGQMRLVVVSDERPRPGMSGAPVLVDGRLVGHLSSSRREDLACIPVWHVRALVESQGLAQGRVFVSGTGASEGLVYDELFGVLAEELRREGLVPYRRDRVSISGGAQGAGELLDGARAAVVLLTDDWVSWTVGVADLRVLLARVAADPDFVVLVIKLAGVDVPERLALFPVFEVSLPMTTGALAHWGLGDRIRNGRALSRVQAAAKEGADALLRTVAALQASGRVTPAAAIAAAEALVVHDRNEAALDLLGATASTPLVIRVRARVLAAAGRSEEAVELLDRVFQQDGLDVEGMAMLGSIKVEQWQKGQHTDDLDQAFAAYSRAFARGGRAQEGAMAAKLALFRGDAQWSHDLARTVRQATLERSTDAGQREAARWAILAETSLMTGDRESAQSYYRRLVEAAGTQFEQVAEARRQARLIQRHLRGGDSSNLEEWLPVPGVVAFLGEPPSDDEWGGKDRLPFVDQRIGGRLEALRTHIGFCCAVSPADVAFVEAMQRRSGVVRVFVPAPIEALADRWMPAEWAWRLKTSVEMSREIQVIGMGTADDARESAYDRCLVHLLGAARAQAEALDQRPLLLAVDLPGQREFVSHRPLMGAMRDIRERALDAWKGEGGDVEFIEGTPTPTPPRRRRAA